MIILVYTKDDEIALTFKDSEAKIPEGFIFFKEVYIEDGKNIQEVLEKELFNTH